MKLPHHGRYSYSSIVDRVPYTWPGGESLAVHVCVAVEHFAFGAGVGEDFAVLGAPQSQRNYGWREYGSRVGLWRVLEMLDALGVPVTLLVNGLVPAAQPDLAERLRARGDEVVGHGRTSSESTAGLWAADESAAIAQSTHALEGFFGRRPSGWASPGMEQGPRTLEALVRHGYRYVLDWPADDQPFWLGTSEGPILSVPFPLDTNDLTVAVHRHHSGRGFADMVVHQFEEMLRLSDARPLVMPLMLHPYVVGQPFRLGPLRKALAHCRAGGSADKVWWSRPGAIAEHCRSLPEHCVP